MKDKQFPFEGSTCCPNEEVWEWLNANIGKSGIEWQHYATSLLLNVVILDHYRFRTEQSAIWFKLRWS